MKNAKALRELAGTHSGTTFAEVVRDPVTAPEGADSPRNPVEKGVVATTRDEWGLALDHLLSRYQSSVAAVFEREASEAQAWTDDAIWEMERYCERLAHDHRRLTR